MILANLLRRKKFGMLVDKLVLSKNDVEFLRRVNAGRREVPRIGTDFHADPMRAEGLANLCLFERRRTRYLLTYFGREVAHRMRGWTISGDSVELNEGFLMRLRPRAEAAARPFKELTLSGAELDVLRVLWRSPFLPLFGGDPQQFDAVEALEHSRCIENVDGMWWLSPRGMCALAQASRAGPGYAAAVRVPLLEGEFTEGPVEQKGLNS